MSRGWRTYVVTMASGGEEIIHQVGEFFYVVSVSPAVDFELGMDDDALDYAKVGVEGRLPAGETFAKLRLRNPGGSAISVRVAAGFGTYSDSEAQISGAVPLALSDSLTTAAVTVGTTAVLIAAADIARKSVMLKNAGASPIYVGGPAVTVGDGMPVGAGEGMVITWTTAAIWAVTESGTCEVRGLVE